MTKNEIQQIASELIEKIDRDTYLLSSTILAHPGVLELDIEAYETLLKDLYAQGIQVFDCEPQARKTNSSDNDHSTTNIVCDFKKKPKTNLVIDFSDGKHIHKKKALEAFIEAIEHIGVERVRGLDYYFCGIPFIAENQTERYSSSQKNCGNYFVFTYNSTEKKKEILDNIANALGIELSVKLTQDYKRLQTRTDLTDSAENAIDKIAKESKQKKVTAKSFSEESYSETIKPIEVLKILTFPSQYVDTEVSIFGLFAAVLGDRATIFANNFASSISCTFENMELHELAYECAENFATSLEKQTITGLVYKEDDEIMIRVKEIKSSRQTKPQDSHPYTSNNGAVRKNISTETDQTSKPVKISRIYAFPNQYLDTEVAISGYFDDIADNSAMIYSNGPDSSISCVFENMDLYELAYECAEKSAETGEEQTITGLVYEEDDEIMIRVKEIIKKGEKKPRDTHSYSSNNGAAKKTIQTEANQTSKTVKISRIYAFPNQYLDTEVSISGYFDDVADYSAMIYSNSPTSSISCVFENMDLYELAYECAEKSAETGEEQTITGLVYKEDDEIMIRVKEIKKKGEKKSRDTHSYSSNNGAVKKTIQTEAYLTSETVKISRIYAFPNQYLDTEVAISGYFDDVADYSAMIYSKSPTSSISCVFENMDLYELAYECAEKSAATGEEQTIAGLVYKEDDEIMIRVKEIKKKGEKKSRDTHSHSSSNEAVKKTIQTGADQTSKPVKISRIYAFPNQYLDTETEISGYFDDVADNSAMIYSHAPTSSISCVFENMDLYELAYECAEKSAETGEEQTITGLIYKEDDEILVRVRDIKPMLS